MKVCVVCGIEKDEGEFYRGRKKCKTCCVEYAKKWQGLNIGKRNASIRRWRVKNPERAQVYRRNWEAKNEERNREIDLAHHRRWRKRNLSSLNKKAKEVRVSDPIRVRARDAVLNATRRGKITRPESCERCGTVCRVHGHHSNYTQALKVVWLCPKCHVDEHRLESYSQSSRR